MARKLTANVAVRNPKTGVVEVFTPDGDVPSWAESLIDNDDVWDGPARRTRAKSAGDGDSGDAAQAQPKGGTAATE